MLETHFDFSDNGKGIIIFYIGEGNGNPLLYFTEKNKWIIG